MPVNVRETQYLYTPRLGNSDETSFRHPLISMFEIPYAVAIGIGTDQISPENIENHELKEPIVRTLTGLLAGLQEIASSNIEWIGPYSKIREKGNYAVIEAQYHTGEAIQIQKSESINGNIPTLAVRYFDSHIGYSRKSNKGNKSHSAELRFGFGKNNYILELDLEVYEHTWKQSLLDQLILDKSVPRRNIVDAYLGNNKHHVHVFQSDPASNKQLQQIFADQLGVGELLSMDTNGYPVRK